MKITIEVEAPECPEGFQYTGEYRKPEVGEYCLFEETCTVILTSSNLFTKRYFILKKIPIRPKWLKPGWVGFLEIGWVWFENRPTYNEEHNLFVAGEGSWQELNGTTLVDELPKVNPGFLFDWSKE